ncbi:tyrosine-type recombinase/integrase [Acidisphaera rubrifaciens]|uniref:tyrosine-type recombinase/integrase n=1 Tax=Acidisphaera rubrifaciens TaxID=50715 RepID=UPI00130E5A13|nr:site-specific integrase [Acidisphaera rubrifaciens]
MNHAYREGNAKTDEAWRRVKPFNGTQAARVRYLSDEEARRLINACAPDFRAIVHAALLTGMRYGELSALQVKDVDITARIATVRHSKAGKPRTVILTDEATELLRQQMLGMSGGSLVLARADEQPWGKSHQHRPLRDACVHAAITPPISFHGLRHSFASRLAMRGVPMAVIAAALGNSEAICARHYAHLAPGYIADTVRLALGRLAEPTNSNLTQLRRSAV